MAYKDKEGYQHRRCHRGCVILLGLVCSEIFSEIQILSSNYYFLQTNRRKYKINSSQIFRLQNYSMLEAERWCCWVIFLKYMWTWHIIMGTSIFSVQKQFLCRCKHIQHMERSMPQYCFDHASTIGATKKLFISMSNVHVPSHLYIWPPPFYIAQVNKASTVVRHLGVLH